MSLDAALDAALAADMPVNVGAMKLLAEAETPGAARDLVAARLASGRAAADHAARLHALLACLDRHPDAWGTVRAVLAEADHRGGGGPADWAATFDRIARVSPESGSALYALGSPDLLAAATAEVVDRLRDWGLTGPDRAVLEIGCGYGRLTLALADHVGTAVGLDVSPVMVAEACRRAGDRPHVRFAVTAGEDLAGVPDASVDLVLAADVFPYLVASGRELPRRHVREAARVLRPAGALAIFNWSYRGDPARDRADAAALFTEGGFSPERIGTRDVRLWDGVTFLGRRPAEPSG